ncbi:MAG: hypothetical protein P8Z41_13690 [Anaerolineales bacterium]
MNKETHRIHITNFILIAVILLQLFFLLDSYGLIWSKRVVRLIGHDARERSAVYTFGNRFSEYVSFLESLIPEDGLVIKPFNRFGGHIAYEGIMRYFFMPRDIGDCPVEGNVARDCYIAVGDNAYILAVGDFPGEGINATDKDFIPFQPEYFYRGLYVPSIGVGDNANQ